MTYLSVQLLSADARLVASLRRSLRALGYEMHACLMHEAAEQSAHTKADVVVLDSRTTEDLRLYQALPAGRLNDPVVAIVPSDRHELAWQALQAGAAALLTPPISRSSLSLALTTALERGRLLEVERRRATIAEALTRATATISFSLDATEIYKQMLSLLGTVVDFDTATLYRIENGIAHAFGDHRRLGDRFYHSEARFPVHEDPIFALWLEQRRVVPELILDTSKDPRWPWLASKDAEYISSVRSYIGAPMVVDGEIIGALTLGNFQPHTFDQVTVVATHEFAERITRALRNVRLFDLERAANARLQDVMHLQDEFVATVSHELRTPLTSILGFSENLLDHWHHLDDAHKRASIEKVQRAGKRLDQLVRDLLQISRIEARSLRMRPAVQQVMPIIRQTVEDLALKYAGQAVRIAPELEHALVWADGDRLRQVLTNLLDNAAKYSPAGSPIAVTWMHCPPCGTIGVHDHGPGIHPEDVPRLFQRFSKLNTIARPGHVGTGLGLYICKQLVEAMGGTIWYTNTTDMHTDGNSAFYIQLPLTGQGDATTRQRAAT